MLKWFTNPAIMERVEKLEIPFNKYGIDKYGISKKHLGAFYTALGKLYHGYFSITTEGAQHIPDVGRAMVVGNHSGGIAIDGAMVIASLFFEKNPPRLAQSMLEKFITSLPFASHLSQRFGQMSGLPEHAIQLLENDRLLVVFPEGARGTAKLYKDRYSLVRFGRGFMRLALQTNTPIVPFAFIGGGEIFPTIANLYSLGRLVGAPYIPITRYLLPIPVPRPCQIYYGEAMHFEGDGMENDDVIEKYTNQVKDAVAGLIEKGRQQRYQLASSLKDEEG